MKMNDNSKGLLIGLYGKKGAGKSTLAKMLWDAGPIDYIQPMAAPLKKMLDTLFTDVMGIEATQATAYLYGKDKETVIPEFSDLEKPITARALMQTLGTEWGRHNFGEDFWPLIWKARVRSLAEHTSHLVICCDDVRFDSEVFSLVEMGIELNMPVLFVDVFTKETAMQDFDSHESEQGVEKTIEHVVNSAEQGVYRMSVCNRKITTEELFEDFLRLLPQNLKPVFN